MRGAGLRYCFPMSKEESVNELYFVVMPQISLSLPDYGRVSQFLTLLPGKDLATEFFPDQVDTFIQVFKNREQHLTGGHVVGYECEKEVGESGVRVKVTQKVIRDAD
jgi:hypothetical protein